MDDLEPTIGPAPARYVAELVARARAVLGGDLLAVCLMGSGALGDYRPERSDIDVAVITHRALAQRAPRGARRRARA